MERPLKEEVPQVENEFVERPLKEEVPQVEDEFVELPLKEEVPQVDSVVETVDQYWQEVCYSSVQQEWN